MPTMGAVKIGDRVKELRERKLLTQAELGAAAEVSRNQVSRIERDEWIPGSARSASSPGPWTSTPPNSQGSSHAFHERPRPEAGHPLRPRLHRRASPLRLLSRPTDRGPARLRCPRRLRGPRRGIQDAGQSGASLERPGMDRVRDLVTAGGVSVVLAQDRDRFAREPAYLFYLREEFAQHQTALRALNDRGDESPEGELTTGILDQIARYERLKIAERSRRGKLRKAREGKIVATKHPTYGFRYNASRDGYEVDQETIAIIARIVRMVGTEGIAIRGVKRIFEREGLRSPQGKDRWGQFFIRGAINDDAYRPHSREEIENLVAKGQMSPEVASRLDPDMRYGIWWFNRRRIKTYQETVNGPDGKRYKKRSTTTWRPEAEWIAVPVPDSGIPQESIDLAREAIKDNVKYSQNNRRPWVISGGIARCGECGWGMSTHSVWGPKSKHVNHYYRCSKAQVNYAYKSCSNTRHHRADRLEPLVWNYVSGVMKDPEGLRADLDRMIELEKRGVRGDPSKDAKLWAKQLADGERKRAKYQEAFAADAMTLAGTQGVPGTAR